MNHVLFIFNITAKHFKMDTKIAFTSGRDPCSKPILAGKCPVESIGKLALTVVNPLSHSDARSNCELSRRNLEREIEELRGALLHTHRARKETLLYVKTAHED